MEGDLVAGMIGCSKVSCNVIACRLGSSGGPTLGLVCGSFGAGRALLCGDLARHWPYGGDFGVGSGADFVVYWG